MSAHAQVHHRNYPKIWAILVVLLVISVAGPFVGIRVVTLLTAFGIAVVKAYLVAKNFMHLDVEKPVIHWMMAIAVVFMALLFAGVSPDVMKEDGLRWKKDAGFHPEATSGHGGGQHGGVQQNGGQHSESDTSGTNDDHGRSSAGS